MHEHAICRQDEGGGVRRSNFANVTRVSAQPVSFLQQAIGPRLCVPGCGVQANIGLGFLRGRGPVAYEFLSIPVDHLGREPGERDGGRRGNNKLGGELQYKRLGESIELPKLHSFEARGHLRANRSGEVSAILGYQFLAERHTLRSQYVNR